MSKGGDPFEVDFRLAGNVVFWPNYRYLIRYNSRLPIVVYAPEGVEIRYRIWSAGPETKAVEKG